MPGDLQVAGVREGDVLAGKYRIDKILGAGGMGVVVAAHHIQLDERVALKFLLPESLGNQDVIARFIREARAAVKIKSEHVARVSDVGTLPNGAPYIVMEYLEGGDLADWLRLRGALPIEQAIDFVLQACLAVAEAHRLGIVHRDLKPANLFCVRGADGEAVIKVLDFGISKIGEGAPGGALSMTATSAVMGSPLYMSPEQMRSSKDVDARTDIWALGVIVYQLLTAQTPFEGDSIADLAIRVATEPPGSLRSLRPDAPAELEAVIERCLRKDRNQRYADVAELTMALAPFGSSGARAAAKRVVAILHGGEGERTATASWSSSSKGGAPALLPETAPPVGHTSPASRARSLSAWAILAIAGGVSAAVALGIFGGGRALRQLAAGQGSASGPVATSSATLGPAPSVPTAAAAAASDPPPPQRGPADAEALEAASVPAGVAPVLTPLPRRDAGAAHPVHPQPPPVLPAVDCNPPYTVDSAGHRQYKAECP
jgi:serine/threonine-protein kinase